MPLNNYACHIANVCVPLHFYCHLHITPHLRKNNKLQHLIIILLPYMHQQELFPLNATCAISSYAHKRQLFSIYTYTNSLQSTMWQTAPVYIYFTLLAYGPEQICLLHCTYMFHYTATVLDINTQQYLHIRKQTATYNLCFPCYCLICANLNMLPNAIYNPHRPIRFCRDMRELYQYVCLIWNQCSQQCHNKHWYTYISHYWPMPLSKYACHVLYVCSLHYYCSVHIHPT